MSGYFSEIRTHWRPLLAATIGIGTGMSTAGTITNRANVKSALPDLVPVNSAATNTTLVKAPPTISDITDKSTNEDISTAAIPFTIGDAETPAASLTLGRSSSF